MSTNRNLLKEAIADAKTVKETAIANAKAVLEESFGSQLKSMISLKLQEMDTDGDENFSSIRKEALDEEGLEEDLDLNELFKELNENEDEDEEIEIEKSEESEENENEGEPIDFDDFTDKDLKDMIEDVLMDLMKDGKVELDNEDETMSEMKHAADDDIDLEELLREIGGTDDEDDLEEISVKGAVKGAINFAKQVGSAIASTFSSKVQGWDEYQKTPEFGNFAGKYIGEDGTIDPAKLTDPAYKKDAGDLGQHYMQWLIKTYKLDPSVARPEANDLIDSIGLLAKRGKSYSSATEFTGGGVREIQAELEEAYATIKTLRQDLNEINLLNAKLLYTNKIFKSKNLNENQKVKVLGSFDKATTVKEVKLVFETLNEGLKTKTTKLNENLGSASKVLNTPKKQPIVESNDMVARFQKLAGII